MQQKQRSTQRAPAGGQSHTPVASLATARNPHKCHQDLSSKKNSLEYLLLPGFQDKTLTQVIKSRIQFELVQSLCGWVSQDDQVSDDHMILDETSADPPVEDDVLHGCEHNAPDDSGRPAGPTFTSNERTSRSAYHAADQPVQENQKLKTSLHHMNICDLLGYAQPKGAVDADPCGSFAETPLGSTTPQQSTFCHRTSGTRNQQHAPERSASQQHQTPARPATKRATGQNERATNTVKLPRAKKPCQEPGCPNKAVAHGRCGRHGGGKQCYIEDCNNRVQRFGLCWIHGGYRFCEYQGCRNRAKSKGLCTQHGGIDVCSAKNCTTHATSHGLCWAHGGGRRCRINGCRRLAYKIRENFCCYHFEKHTVSSIN